MQSKNFISNVKFWNTAFENFHLDTFTENYFHMLHAVLQRVLCTLGSNRVNDTVEKSSYYHGVEKIKLLTSKG